MPNLEDQEYLTITQAAKVKCCTRTTIYAMIEAGKIKIEVIAGHKLIANTEEFQKVNPKSHLWKRRKREKEKVEQLEDRVERLELETKDREYRLIQLERRLGDIEVKE